MKKNDSMIKILRGICYIFLMACVYFLIGFIISTIATRFFGYKSTDCMILLIVSILLCINGIVIGRNTYKQVKSMSIKNRKKIMQKQIKFIAFLIIIALVASIICAIQKSVVGALYSLGIIVGLLMWELGAYLGYKSLESKKKTMKK